MNTLASTHLRQAKSFLRAGDPQRAVELLEKAKALVRDDVAVEKAILDALASAYQQTGQGDKASRCLERLDRLGGPHQQAAVGFTNVGSLSTSAPPPQHHHWLLFGALAMMVLLILVVCVVIWRQGQFPLGGKREAASIPNSSVVSPPNAPSSANPATGGAVLATPLAAQAVPSSAMPSTLDQQVRECVGLLMVMGRYEGMVNSMPIKVDWPLSSGTVFAISRSGLVLTNKHVTQSGKNSGAPGSLQAVGLPTVTLRSIHFVACFGPDKDDRAEATLVHESDTYDLALLKTDRRFKSAFTLSYTKPRQGEEVRACGYPGALCDIFNKQPENEPNVMRAVGEIKATSTADLLDAFSPESFKPTMTRGIVSVAERNIKGVAFVQTDLKASPGNSGGPLFDSSGQVIAIMTLAGQADASGYNFGLLMDQLKDEIEPFINQK